MPLTSFLASSALAAMQNTVTIESTAENRAIRRYRMMTLQALWQVDPAVERPSRHRWDAAVLQELGVYFFRPRAGINTRPRHFFGTDNADSAVFGHTRRTLGQSTSSSGSTQGSWSAAARHSAQAGSAITASTYPCEAALISTA